LRIAVIFFNIGGYHAARLKATSVLMRSRGCELSAIEILGHSSQHPWQFDRSDMPYGLVTLFENEADISSKQLKRKLRVELEQLKPEVLVLPGWGSLDAKVALDWARAKGIRTVVMSESKEDDAPRNAIKEWYKSLRFIRKYDAGLVGGHAHRDYLQALGMPGNRIFLGYDAVDNQYFQESVASIRAAETTLRNKMPNIPAKPYFLSVTRFIPRKNLVRLLDSYGAYCRQVGIENAWPLVLCGSGIEEANIRQSVDRLGLAGLVHFPGFITYENVPYWYAFAGAFVHPAIQEQWGLVVNEAAASGLPILCSNTVGAAAELVKNGLNGFTFQPLDGDAITEALLNTHQLGTDSLAAMGKASQEIVAQWGPQRFAEGLSSAVSAVAH
jgi:glycosyltransferase involved in cell wall biosynthesis